MKNQEQKVIIDGLKGLMHVQKQNLDVQDHFIAVLRRIIKVISILIDGFKYIIFILALLVWKVFLSEPINLLIGKSVKQWSSLSEGWQIAAVTIFGSFIASIVAILIGNFLWEKVKDLILRKND